MTKAKIAWITDTTASLSKEFIEQNHIHVIPLHIVINDEFYKETIDISEQEFYSECKTRRGNFKHPNHPSMIL